MSLEVKHRPDCLDAFYGNKETARILKNYFKGPKEKVPHAFLFTGPRGCGKTTLARIAAETVGAVNDCIIEMDSASFNGIDHVRKIQGNIRYLPSGESTARAYILDECHQMSKPAQNAMLKMLEEPPDHVYFFLATTDPQKLIATLKDRCKVLPVAPLAEEELRELMDEVCEAEDKKIPQAVLDEIVENSDRRPRTALNYLDICMVLKKEADMIKAIAPIEAVKTEIIELCIALMEKKAWKKIVKLIKGLEKEEPENIRLAVMGYCAWVALNKIDQAAQAYMVMDSFRETLYDNGKAGLILYCYEVVEGE